MKACRRVLAFVMALLLLCGAGRAECGPDYGSSTLYDNNIIAVGGRVYCLFNDGRSAPFERSNLYAITDDGLEEILTGKWYKAIHAADGKIMLEHNKPTLAVLFSVADSIVVSVILYDPITGEQEVWDRYDPSYSPGGDDEWTSFFAGNDLYTWLRKPDRSEGSLLSVYSAPFEKAVIAEADALSSGHRTFAVMSADTVWFDSTMVRLSIFDYATNTRRDLTKALHLPDSYGARSFDAVLDGTTLFYLSDAGVNVYDIDMQTDQVCLSLPEDHDYDEFVLHDGRIILIDSSSEGLIDVFDLNTGEQLHSTSHSGYMKDCMAYDDVLYLTSEDGVEMIELKSWEKTFLAY